MLACGVLFQVPCQSDPPEDGFISSVCNNIPSREWCKSTLQQAVPLMATILWDEADMNKAKTARSSCSVATIAFGCPDNNHNAPNNVFVTMLGVKGNEENAEKVEKMFHEDLKELKSPCLHWLGCHNDCQWISCKVIGKMFD
jgi:hypothetical protein